MSTDNIQKNNKFYIIFDKYNWNNNTDTNENVKLLSMDLKNNPTRLISRTIEVCIYYLYKTIQI